MDLRATLRQARVPLLAIGFVLAVLGVRSTIEQQRAWSRAVELESAARLPEAVDEYRWCLRWYTPWGPAHRDAALALQDLATRHAEKDPELAVQALDGLRSGLIASRSLWQPHGDLLAHANRELPPLLVRVADRRGDERDKQALLRKFQADYARPVGVGPWVSLAVVAGFVLWLFGLVQTVRRGVDDDGRWTRQGWKWLGLAAGGFGVWLLGMGLG